MKTRTIRHILVGAVVLGSASGLVAEREAKAYSWTEFVTSPPPPYKIYVPTVSRPTTNTAPVTLAPTYADGQLTLYALLDNTDSSGDYNLYEYYGFDAEWFSLSQSGTGVAFDAYYGSTAPWFVTRAGHVWSLENGVSWVKDFTGLSSVSAYNATANNPSGSLFATSNNSTETCSNSGEPAGQCVLQYDPGTSAWPNGTLPATSWGAAQTTADPVTGYTFFLDKNGAVWEVTPVWVELPPPPEFLGYSAAELSTSKCGGGSITFDLIAAKNGTAFGLASDGGVWYDSHSNDCWDEIGTRTFVSIATDNGTSGVGYQVWASDSSGDIWYAD
jgi:hypothetical protein